MVSPRISPNVDDPESAPFFAAARDHRLVVRRCADCGNGIHTPSAHCPFCDSWNTDWCDVRGAATLYSWTTVVHQVHPGYPTPYTIVVVALSDVPHVHMVGMLPGAPPLTPGMAMTVWFDTLEDGVVIPQWKPV